MFRIMISVAAIVLGTVVLQLGNGMVGPTVVLRASAAGEGLAGIGLIPAAYGVGFVIGCFWGRRLIERIGHIRGFVVAGALLAALAIAMQLLPNTTAWIFIRAMMGCSIAVISTCADSWVGHGTPWALRGRVLGLYAASTKLAHVAAPSLLALSPFISDQAILLAALLFALSLLPVAMTSMPAPEMEPTQRVSFSILLSAAPSSIVAAFAIGLANGAILNLLPAHGVSIGLPQAEVLAMLAAAHVGGLVWQWPIGMLSDAVDRRVVLAGGLVGAAFVAVAMSVPTVARSDAAIFLVFAWGGMALSLYSVSLAHAIDHFERDDLLALCATMLITWSIGSVLGPALAGLLMQLAGADAMFLFGGACQGMAGVFVVFRLLNTVRRKRSSGFVNVPVSSAEIHMLDPRRG
ncbi:MAG: MFS transporter [Alphaproteobacteria bacterium]|nr:MFS transporter [Alphaproteobacteria bacterium]